MKVGRITSLALFAGFLSWSLAANPAQAGKPTSSAASAPMVEPSLSATPISASQISLTWTDPNTSETKFGVERSLGLSGPFSQIANPGRNVTSFTDTGLAASTTYYYRVRAIGRKGAASPYSNVASATTAASAPSDTTAPSVPTGLTASAQSCSQTSLSWNASSDSGGSGLKGYNVYRNGGYVKQVLAPTTSTSDTGLAASTTYSYTVSAVDNAGNQSPQSIAAGATTQACADTQPPTVSVTTPPASSTYTSAGTVMVSASASDNMGVTRVDFYDNGALKGTDSTAPFSYGWSITSASNGSHNWAAMAYDAAGNNTMSPQVPTTVNIPAADTTAPTVSITSPGSGTTYTSAQTVTINVSASDNVAVAKVDFFRNGSFVGTDTAAPYSRAWSVTSADNGSHAWSVTASDTSGNSRDAGPITLTVNIPTADTTAPTIPTGLSASASSCSQAALSWNASTDTGGSGLKGYNVYRDNVFVQQVLAPSTSASSGGLSGSTTYSFTVSAIDNADNESPKSVAAGVTTPACSSTPGAHLWSRASGGPLLADNAMAYGVAVDGGGNVYVTGTFEGTVNFGGGNLTGASQTPDIFVAKYNAAGTHQWSKRFGSSGSDAGMGIAVDSAGDVLVTGRIQDSVDFGGGPVASDANSYNVFLVKLNSSGVHLWSKAFGSTMADIANAVAVDGSGNVAITGYFTGSVNFGGGSLTSNGSTDVFVARYSSSGAHLWSQAIGGTSSDMGLSVAMDSTGSVIVSGAFQGSVNFGGGALTSTGDRDIFVAKYSASAAHVWSKRFGNLLDDYGRAVAVDGGDNVILAGSFQSTVNFGGFALGEPLTISVGLSDVFVVKFNSSGNYVANSAKRYGGASDDAALGLAVDAAGSVAMTGYFQGSMSFGGGTLSSAGSRDVFLVKLGPSGSHQWSRGAGGANNDNGNAVAMDAGGNVAGAGDFSDSANFGGSTLTSPGGTSAFTVEFAP